jgi:peptidoglycan-N-acetylglucosamine deacetylase
MVMAKEILCAFSVDFDAVSVWLGTFGGEKSPSGISRGMFGGEVGVPRLLKLFQRFGIKTSWFVPGHSIETIPEQTRMIVESGHEIGLHGYTHEDPQAMMAEQEEIVLDRCIELIGKASGRRPTGYVARNWEYSSSTLRLLLKKGIKYDHNLMHRDFEPYYVRDGDQWTAIDYSKHPNKWMKPLVRGKPTRLICLPGNWRLDDMPPFLFLKRSPNSHGFVSPRNIERQWRDQFDWVYRECEYAIFIISIHPDVSGRPEVLLMLERLYGHMIRHAGVTFTTLDAMADDFARRQPT